eukprot:15443987-Alexandrium_andersonii.AAC.1
MPQPEVFREVAYFVIIHLRVQGMCVVATVLVLVLIVVPVVLVALLLVAVAALHCGQTAIDDAPYG